MQGIFKSSYHICPGHGGLGVIRPPASPPNPVTNRYTTFHRTLCDVTATTSGGAEQPASARARENAASRPISRREGRDGSRRQRARPIIMVVGPGRNRGPRRSGRGQSTGRGGGWAGTEQRLTSRGAGPEPWLTWRVGAANQLFGVGARVADGVEEAQGHSSC